MFTDTLGDVMDGDGMDMGLDMGIDTGDIIENVVEGVGDFVDNAADATSNAVEAVGEVVGDMVDTAADMSSNVVDAVSNVAENVVDNVADFGSNVADVAGNVVDAVDDSNLAAASIIASSATQAPPTIFPRSTGSLTRGSLMAMNLGKTSPKRPPFHSMQINALEKSKPSFMARVPSVPITWDSIKASSRVDDFKNIEAMVPGGAISNSGLNIGRNLIFNVDKTSGLDSSNSLSTRDTTQSDSIKWSFRSSSPSTRP